MECNTNFCPITPDLKTTISELATITSKLEHIVSQISEDKQDRKDIWDKIDNIEVSISEAKGAMKSLKVVFSIIGILMLPILTWLFASILDFKAYIARDEQRYNEEQIAIADLKKTDEKIFSILGKRGF